MKSEEFFAWEGQLIPIKMENEIDFIRRGPPVIIVVSGRKSPLFYLLCNSVEVDLNDLRDTDKI